MILYSFQHQMKGAGNFGSGDSTIYTGTSPQRMERCFFHSDNFFRRQWDHLDCFFSMPCMLENLSETGACAAGGAGYYFSCGRCGIKELDPETAAFSRNACGTVDSSASKFFISQRTYIFFLCGGFWYLSRSKELGDSRFHSGCADWFFKIVFVCTLPHGCSCRRGVGAACGKSHVFLYWQKERMEMGKMIRL